MQDSKHSAEAGTNDTTSPGLRTCVRLLLERFPHLQSVSTQLLETHETFRELCEEYEACTQAIDRLAPGESDVAIVKEFSALRLRLEAELLRYISEHWSDDSH